MSITQEQLNVLLSDNCKKEFTVFINSYKFQNDSIVLNSLKIKESLFSGRNFEVVGCISNVLEVTLYNVPEKIKNAVISVKVKFEKIEEPLLLFTGYVDSAIKTNDRRFKKITAYDCMYKNGNKNVAAWYNSLQFPITVKQFRDSLSEQVGIKQVNTKLINDDFIITNKYAFKNVKAVDLFKTICQFNGCFGIINRSGLLEYRTLNSQSVPSENTYPSNSTFPNNTAGDPIPFYENIEFEDYEVKPIERLIVRDDDKTIGAVAGNGTNTYIIEANLFAYERSSEEIQNATNKLFEAINNISFTPYKAKLRGLPYLECGKDMVLLYVRDGEEMKYKMFHIMERTFSGAQSLTDEYSASGEEDQNEYISKINLDLASFSQDNFNKNISDRVEEIEDDGLKAESVYSVPSSWEKNTIYFIIKDEDDE